jgi:hypothetical protein
MVLCWGEKATPVIDACNDIMHIGRGQIESRNGMHSIRTA